MAGRAADARSGRGGRATRRGLLASLLLLLAGCIDESREQALGEEMAGSINSQIALIRNPLLNAYVSTLGTAIASVSGRPELDYRFYIVNSAGVNAFALPGGHIYVTRGLIERTRTGPELAGILAHEIGHVVQRHGVDKLQRHLRTGSLVNVMYDLTLRGEPEILRHNSVRLAGMLWTASHSREDEQEADRLAVAYLVEMGVDPAGVVSLFQHLLEEERSDSGHVEGWFSTHPLTTQRIAETREEIETELREESRRQTSPSDAPLRFTTYPAFLRVMSSLPPPPDVAE